MKNFMVIILLGVPSFSFMAATRPRSCEFTLVRYQNRRHYPALELLMHEEYGKRLGIATDEHLAFEYLKRGEAKDRM